MAADFRLNMATLIEIANEVNERTCRPMAEATADRARAAAAEFAESGEYRDSIFVEVQPRSAVAGNHSWARTIVGSSAPYAGRVESRHGTLSRALG